MCKMLCRAVLLAGLVPGGDICAQNPSVSLRHAIEQQADLPRDDYFTILAGQSTLTEADLVRGLKSTYPLVQRASVHKLAELPSLQPSTVKILADVAVADVQGDVTPHVAAALLQIGLYQPELVAPLVADVRPIRFLEVPEPLNIFTGEKKRVAVSDIAISALMEAGYTDLTLLLELQANAPPSIEDRGYLEAGSSDYYALAIAALVRNQPVDFDTFQSVARAKDKKVRSTAYVIAQNVVGRSADVIATLVALTSSDSEEEWNQNGPVEALMSVGPDGEVAVKTLLSSTSEVLRRRAAFVYYGRHGCDVEGMDALSSLTSDALSSAMSAMTKNYRAEFYACLAPLVTSGRFARDDKLHLILRLLPRYFEGGVLPDSVRSMWNHLLTESDDPLWLSLASSIGSDSGVSIPIEELRRRLRASRTGQATREAGKHVVPLTCLLSALLSKHPGANDTDAILLLDRFAASRSPDERNCLHDGVAVLHSRNPRFPPPPLSVTIPFGDVDNIDALLDQLEATGAASVPVRKRTALVLKILENPMRKDDDQYGVLIARRVRRATRLLLGYPGGEQKALMIFVKNRSPFVRTSIMRAVAGANAPPAQRAAFVELAKKAVNDSSEEVQASAVYALAALQPKAEFLVLAKQFASVSASAKVRYSTFIFLERLGYLKRQAIEENLAALMAVTESYEASEPHLALELVSMLGVSSPTQWRRERIRQALALEMTAGKNLGDSLSKVVRDHWDVASELMVDFIDAGLSSEDIGRALNFVSEENALVFKALMRRYQQDPTAPHIAMLLVRFQPGGAVIPEVRARLKDTRPEVARIAASAMFQTFARSGQLDSGDAGAIKDNAVATFVARRLNSILGEIRPWTGGGVANMLSFESEHLVRETQGQHSLFSPQFPWPPPPWSFKEDLGDSMLGDAATLGQAYDHIVAAFRKVSPDYDYGLFFVPEGIVVLARMERILRDGTPLEGRKRWEAGFVRPTTFKEYFEELLFSPPGHFRSIVLVLAATEPTKSDENAVLLEAFSGLKRFPGLLRNLPLDRLTTTALIYTFERSNSGKVSRGYSGSPGGLTHLSKAGLLGALSAD